MAKAKLFLCKKCGFKHADHACDELPLHTIRKQEYERSLANIGRPLSEVNPNLKPKRFISHTFDRFVPLEKSVPKYKAKNRPQVKSKTKRQVVYERDGHKCLRCGDTKRLTLDHVIPVSKGGSSEVDNLQTLCFDCNCLKDNDTIDYRDSSTDLTEEEAVAYFKQCLDEIREKKMITVE
jgi:5-methylcytosine-specific restriction endonuclease McrA